MKTFNTLLFYICLPFFLLSTIDSIAQKVTQVEALNRISQSKSIEFHQKKAVALAFAKQNNIPVIIELDGRVAELMQLDSFGNPQYYITDNTNVASTVSTKKLYPGAGFGFSLNGTNTTINEWDAGAVMNTHQELSGRAIQVDGAV